MKKRYAGGIGALILIGILIGQWLKVPGLGGGSGGLPSESRVDSETEVDSSDAGTQTVSVNSDVSGAATSMTPQSEAMPFLTVAIDADQFRLTTADAPSEGTNLSLGEIVDRVTKTTGSEEGIRLRILFYKNAQEGALADLHAALDSAGIKREEIQEITGYID